MTAQMPSCPRCTLNDRVISLPAPKRRHDHPLVDAEADWPFECLRCVLVFTGTEEEFLRMFHVRDKYRTEQERKKPPLSDVAVQP